MYGYSIPLLAQDPQYAAVLECLLEVNGCDPKCLVAMCLSCWTVCKWFVVEQLV